MKVPQNYYTEIFNFNGLWEQPSLCGLKVVNKNNKTIVIVTELYQENPGTSVTATGKKLAEQICNNKGLTLSEIMYVECNPDTNSVLDFYDEQYYEVTFIDAQQTNYRRLSKDEIEHLIL